MNILTAIFCVLLFSLTVPFTRIAALEMPALLIVGLRLFVAGIFCAVLMWRQKWVPPRQIWWRILLAALGAVLGFSLLLAMALREVPGTHGAVALAALPAVTAAYSTLRDRSRPGWLFWFFTWLGSGLCMLYFAANGMSSILQGDWLLLLAVFTAAFGYVEGGRLSREHGGTRVMSWAVLMALPVSIVLLLSQDLQPARYSLQAWGAILYLALVSQAIGMFLWFRVLAAGPMEKIALLQLLQPFFSLLAAVFLLHEGVGWQAWLAATLVLCCIAGALRCKAAPV